MSRINIKLPVPLLALIWILVIAGAAFWLVRPAPEYVPPAGWRFWPETGAVLDILDKEGEVITAGQQGLFRIDGGKQAVPVLIPGFKVPPIAFSLAQDQHGRLWVGHQSGIAIRNGQSWFHIGKLAGRPLKDVRSIQIAKDGTIWAGSDGALHRIPPQSDTLPANIGLNARSVLSDVKVMTMLLDAQGGLWAGTIAELFYLDGERQQRWGVKDGLPNPQVSALMQDVNGRIWAGTGFDVRGGTVIFAKKARGWIIEKTLPLSLLAAPKTRSLFQDAMGRIWLGSETAGLSIIKQDRILKKITPDNGLPAREVTVMKHSSDHGVWLGTLKGLIHIRPPVEMYTAP